MPKSKDKKEYILEYDLLFMNIFSFVLMLLFIGLTIFLAMLFPSIGDSFKELITNKIKSIFLVAFFVVMIFWLILHEIIHGLAYQITGAKKENIVYGVSLENGVLYCKCKEYVDKKCIMVSLLSPLVVIGIITYIIGFLINSVWLILLSTINIIGAAGDIMMFNFFRKQKDDIEFKELGFSSPFCLRTNDNLIGKRYMGIKSIREVTDKKETEEGPEKKVTISKASWGFFLTMFILLALMVVLDIVSKLI